MRNATLITALIVLLIAAFGLSTFSLPIIVAAQEAAETEEPPSLADMMLLKDTSLVDSIPCAPPCWNNITPGETTWADALQIIEDDSRLNVPEIEEIEAEDNSVILRVSFEVANTGVVCCQMFSEAGEFVTIIFIQLAPLNTVGDVIAVHGEPQYAIGSEFSETQAVINLVYPDLQLVIYALVSGRQGAITAESEVIAALYMMEREMLVLRSTNNLHLWQGYAGFEDYAPDAETFDVTPLPPEKLNELLIEHDEQ